jgi:hypothetical protein
MTVSEIYIFFILDTFHLDTRYIFMDTLSSKQLLQYILKCNEPSVPFNNTFVSATSVLRKARSPADDIDILFKGT